MKSFIVKDDKCCNNVCDMIVKHFEACYSTIHFHVISSGIFFMTRSPSSSLSATMRKSGRLDPDVNIEELAALTKNFSGAEIEGLVRAAQSTSLNSYVTATSKVYTLNPDMIVLFFDFNQQNVPLQL